MDSNNKSKQSGEAEIGQAPSGLINEKIELELLGEFDWESYLGEHDWTNRIYEAVKLAESKSIELANAKRNGESLILKMLSAVISMHFVGNLENPFLPMWQKGNRCSAAPEHLGHLDVQFMQAMAKSCHDTWLRARLADVVCVAAPMLGLKGWEMGALAAGAYLDYAKKFVIGDDFIRVMESAKFLQRALHLGWKYRRKDDAFSSEIWSVLTSAIDHALAHEKIGVVFILVEEIIRRKNACAQEIAEKLELIVDAWSGSENLAVVDSIPRAYKAAARLWLVAKKQSRSDSCYHKAANALIKNARGDRQASVRSEWMAEGIAILRRHRGSREKIKELQLELSDIRREISEEMQSFAYSIDASELIKFIEEKVKSADIYMALLEVAFGFSSFISVEEMESEVIDVSEKSIVYRLFPRVTYNEDGVPVERSDALNTSDPGNLEGRVIEHICRSYHPLLANVVVIHAIDLVRNRCQPTLNDLLSLTHSSPVVPEGHEWSIARGLLAGLEQSWEEAATFLIPQAEPFVRAAFKRVNVNTLALKERVEEEKSLSELLSHEDVFKVLHKDIVIELKAILTHRSGHNLRNLFGHGLIKDDQLSSTGTVVLWWTMLRLVLWPYRHTIVSK